MQIQGLEKRDYSMGNLFELEETYGLGRTVLPALLSGVVAWSEHVQAQYSTLSPEIVIDVQRLFSIRVKIACEQLLFQLESGNPLATYIETLIPQLDAWFDFTAKSSVTSTLYYSQEQAILQDITDWWELFSLKKWHLVGAIPMIQCDNSRVAAFVPEFELLFGQLLVLTLGKTSPDFIANLYDLLAEPDSEDSSRPTYEKIIDEGYKKEIALLYFDILQHHRVTAAFGTQKEDNRPALLEIGCGSGLLAYQVPQFTQDYILTGIDKSPSMLQWAQSRGYQTVEARAEALPLQEQHFAAVICSYVMHYLDTDTQKQLLEQAGRVLRPAGVLIFDLRNAQPTESEALSQCLLGLGFASATWYTMSSNTHVLHYCVASKVS